MKELKNWPFAELAQRVDTHEIIEAGRHMVIDIVRWPAYENDSEFYHHGASVHLPNAQCIPFDILSSFGITYKSRDTIGVDTMKMGLTGLNAENGDIHVNEKLCKAIPECIKELKKMRLWIQNQKQEYCVGRDNKGHFVIKNGCPSEMIRYLKIINGLMDVKDIDSNLNLGMWNFFSEDGYRKQKGISIPGVYAFLSSDGDSVYYIGTSESLGARATGHSDTISRIEKEFCKWVLALRMDSIVFEAKSLELALIKFHSPIFNIQDKPVEGSDVIYEDANCIFKKEK